MPRLRAFHRRGASYIVKADISQFYPSIYTHSLCWAIHTKATCKANLRKRKGVPPLWGNDLDKALSNMNWGQTVGIPIGPDTSLVVAEILLATIDQGMANSGISFRGFRTVDDYEFTCSKLSDAENVLTELQGLLSDYELLLNPLKTQLKELPEAFEDNWSIKLRTYEIRPGGPKAQRRDIVDLFSRAMEFASAFPHDYVLKYTLGRVRYESVLDAAWPAFQNCVISAASAEPSALAAALGTLHEVSARGGHQVMRSVLAELFENLISKHAPRAQASEVAWALWGALAWNVNLSNDVAAAVQNMEDDVVALLALHADAQGLFAAGALDKTFWSNLVDSPKVLKSEHWLLAYEANQQGWLNAPQVAKDKIFLHMSQQGVNFYDKAEATPQFPLGGRRIPGGELGDDYA